MRKEIPVIYYKEDERAYYYNLPDPAEKNGRKEVVILKKKETEKIEETEYSEEKILNMKFYVPDIK